MLGINAYTMESTDYREYLEADWNIYRKRILLYADIMGFKAKVDKTEHNKLVSIFRAFIQDLTKSMEPLEIGRHIRLTMFSDTIIIGADSCTIKNFNIIVKAAAILLNLCHRHQFPVNGCITIGNLTFDEFSQIPESELKGRRKIIPYMPMFIGNSVVDAHLLTEELFCYGIVLHPSAEKLLGQSLSHQDEKFHHPFCFMPVPLKSGGSANMHYLNWTKVKTPLNSGNNSVIQADVLSWHKTLENEMSSVRPRAYILNTIKIIEKLSV